MIVNGTTLGFPQPDLGIEIRIREQTQPPGVYSYFDFLLRYELEGTEEENLAVLQALRKEADVRSRTIIEDLYAQRDAERSARNQRRLEILAMPADKTRDDLLAPLGAKLETLQSEKEKKDESADAATAFPATP